MYKEYIAFHVNTTRVNLLPFNILSTLGVREIKRMQMAADLQRQPRADERRMQNALNFQDDL